MRGRKLFKKFSIIMVLSSSCFAAPVSTTNSTGIDKHISIFYTKVILNPVGLCVNAALSLAVSGLSIASVALLSRNFNVGRAEKGVIDHAADKPLYILGMTTLTATTIFFSNQALQNFIAAVQQWYIIPKNIKAVDLANDI